MTLRMSYAGTEELTQAEEGLRASVTSVKASGPLGTSKVGFRDHQQSAPTTTRAFRSLVACRGGFGKPRQACNIVREPSARLQD